MRAYTACGSFNVDNVTVHSLIFQFGLNISIFGKVQFGYMIFYFAHLNLFLVKIETQLQVFVDVRV
jgi:hypothetical protein